VSSLTKGGGIATRQVEVSLLSTEGGSGVIRETWRERRAFKATLGLLGSGWKKRGER